MPAHPLAAKLGCMQHVARGPRYRIRVRGLLGDTLLSAFPELRAEAGAGDTVLVGVLRDQSALYGLLAEFEALGLELLEVRQEGA